MSDVCEFTNPEEQRSPWGNDTIRLSMDDIAGLLQGKKYFNFDGEYGHIIEMEEDNGV